jgi:pimeloyl-ACP methyl ester carboxylesterase
VVPKAAQAENVIPILVAMPLACGAAPAGGWPVTIFQHGITRNREDMLAAASSLSVGGALGGLCTAVLAIDLPLHGVTDTSDPFYTKGFERTFDMDANGAAGAASGDIAGSGTFFINLQSTITSRDNLREGAADLINLVATLPNIHPGGTITLDGTQVFFVGHSLGGIEGTTFLGADTEGAGIRSALTSSTVNPTVTAGVLAMPGGHVAELLRQSPAFGPTIDNGLAQEGLVKDTQEYYDFYSEAQAVVEDGDPANYAALAAKGHIIHMIEVVGGHDASSPDQVVPNSATDVLIGQMGITAPIAANATLAVGEP